LLPVAMLLFLSGCTFGAPRGSSVQGQKIASLYHLMFWIAIGVAAVVYGLILWSVIRYRRRSEELPKQTRYHIPLEITYTVIPILIVLGLFVATYHTEKQVDRVSSDPQVSINVAGFRWQWRFSYPAFGIHIVGTPTTFPTMVVPVGETVQITLRADDVIHAFFVPDFLFKRDAIPGVTNVFDFTVPKAGVFPGECAEFCGLDHADMVFYVKAVSPAQFNRWVTQQQGLVAGGTA